MYLFPHKFKKPSAWIFYSSVVFGISYLFFYSTISSFTAELDLKVPMFFSDHLMNGPQFWKKNNVLDEIISIFIIISGLLYGFSRERVEDELIHKIRLESLAWSVQVNFAFVLMETIFIFGLHFFEVMIIQLFLILLLFNLKQEISLNQFYHSSDEK